MAIHQRKFKGSGAGSYLTYATNPFHFALYAIGYFLGFSGDFFLRVLGLQVSMHKATLQSELHQSELLEFDAQLKERSSYFKILKDFNWLRIRHQFSDKTNEAIMKILFEEFK